MDGSTAQAPFAAPLGRPPNGGGGGAGTLASSYSVGASTTDSTLTLDATRGGITLDGTGLPTTVPLLVKNAKNLSGVEVQVTGTAPSGFVVDNSSGTAKSAFGLAVSANDWITGSAAGDAVLLGDATKFLRIGGLAAAVPVLSVDLANGSILIPGTGGGTNGRLQFTNSTCYMNSPDGTGNTLWFVVGGAEIMRFTTTTLTMASTKKLLIDSNNSLTSVALQISGDPNTGIGQIGGVDTASVVCGGIETARFTSAPTATSGTVAVVAVTPASFAPTSGTAVFRGASLAYTINQTGGANGAVTGIFVNATETAVVGTHALMDLQIGGVSRFRVGSTALNHQVLASQSIPSAAGATWDGVNFAAATATITGAGSITTATGFNAYSMGAPTITAGTALTVSHAATLYIAGPPTAAGSVTLTNGYALWIDSGKLRYDGQVASGGGAAPTFGTIGGSGPGTAAQSGWLPINIDGNARFIPVWA